MRHFNIEGRQAASSLLLGAEEGKLSCDAGDGAAYESGDSCNNVVDSISSGGESGEVVLLLVTGLQSLTTAMSPLSRQRNK
eukprot:14517277-Ditylum_brightwellii.AAC.1